MRSAKDSATWPVPLRGTERADDFREKISASAEARIREESLVPEHGQCMTYGFPVVPEIEEAYRAAHAALEGLASEYGLDYAPETDLGEWTEVVDRFPFIVWGADMAVATRLGPAIDWYQEGHDRGEWGLTV